MRSKKLTKMLDQLEEGTSGRKQVSFENVVDAMEHRGFGALLIGPALITILPTGAIPGVPALSALMIALIAGQLVCGRKEPWLPPFINKMKISSKKLHNALESAKPAAEKIDEFVHTRYKFMTHDIAQRLIAVVCIGLAAAMAIFGFVPMMPALFSLPVLIIAVGITVRDGLLTLSGVACAAGVLTLLLFLLS